MIQTRSVKPVPSPVFHTLFNKSVEKFFLLPKHPSAQRGVKEIFRDAAKEHWRVPCGKLKEGILSCHWQLSLCSPHATCHCSTVWALALAQAVASRAGPIPEQRVLSAGQ